MSMELMVKAMKASVGNPLRKLVLIKLADNASDNGECWPSYQHIADQCEISRRSVINHIKALEESGLLKKVERKGGEKGNHSNLYILQLDGGESPALPSESPAPSGESPAPPPSESPAPRTSHSSEPVKKHIPPNPQGGNAGKPQKRTRKAFALADLRADNPHNVDWQILSDWLVSRDKNRAAVSATVWRRVNSELAKCIAAGVSANEAMTTAVVAGWRGFQADWVIKRNEKNNTHRVTVDRDTCPKCGDSMNDCICWAETINEGPF